MWCHAQLDFLFILSRIKLHSYERKAGSTSTTSTTAHIHAYNSAIKLADQRTNTHLHATLINRLIYVIEREILHSAMRRRAREKQVLL